MKEALKLALEALEWATSCISFDDFDDMPEALEELNKAHQAITSIKEALAQPEQSCPECVFGVCHCNPLAQPEQEPVAWVPYLSDRADGVKGRYAIARWNPRGYREVWNLRRHEWGAYSDDVLSLEEADTLLRLITIPTRKVTSPQPPQPKEPEQEPVAYGMWDTMIGCGGRMMYVRLDKGQDGCTVPLYTIPPQRKLLTDEQWMIEMVDAAMVATRDIVPRITRSQCRLIIEAAHGIKG